MTHLHDNVKHDGNSGLEWKSEPANLRRRRPLQKTAPSAASIPKLSTKAAPPDSETAKKSKNYRFISLALLTALSFASRLYKVDEPKWVCWDETHFGKMASWYINRTFFFDVHPPLGKLSISLVGYLTGYNGSFAWDAPGDPFEDHSYVGMRAYCAVLGALLVPLVFETVLSLSGSVRAASMAGACVLFDTGMITLTRYILLDAPLLFCIMATVWTFVGSWPHAHKDHPTWKWWMWCGGCGVFLSCAISVKFVGLFVVGWVGLVTAIRLGFLWAKHSHTPLTAIVKAVLHRGACLIALPVFLYFCYFAVHLRVLKFTGIGDGFYSSAFQSVLLGNPLNNATMPGEVAYGAMIALKNTKGNGAYLHSHPHPYPLEQSPRGNLQQQVTCYTHKDDHNIWQIRKIDDAGVIAVTSDVQLIQHGDLVRLTHITTGRNLHSHKVSAPITKIQFQVTGYGFNGSGDVNDLWQVDIENGRPHQPIQTMITHFRLVHYATKCILQSGTKQLPTWAFNQLEVTCNPRSKKTDYDSQLFHVEWIYFPLLPNITFSSHTPSFLSRFIESHQVMLKGNSQLKAREQDEPTASRPWQWPINLRGQFFSGGKLRIYLLGNPLVWWGNIVVWFLYGALEVFAGIRRKRAVGKGIDDSIKRALESFLPPCRWMFLGWAVHYLPFFAMGRILYYHHYFPAHLFACMLTGLVVECYTRLDHLATALKARYTAFVG
ncbi:Protein O-mannosyl-transferase 2 [Hypsibius exemplaris]|uniref:Protein O-mannosyl-transferase 2 n=1 Tax=Hypsibius exemplaris TaxID=2072580 RepID=A0A1W0WPH0_HYPEX|nr:Protein O-mannosyl-transferase 2 [Hypsibius exemplaris]